MVHKTKIVRIGGLVIGGGNPIAIQSMTATKTTDIAGTLAQIDELYAAGCDIVRLSVPNQQSAAAFAHIREKSPVPLVADIHFDYKLALAAIEAGADKIRINPGNLGEGLPLVIGEAQRKNIPIRIGVNGGSLSKEIIAEYGRTTQAIIESAREMIIRLNALEFDNIVVSLKSSSVIESIDAYRAFAEEFDYPLHIGITETGPESVGVIKSAVGLGSLLLDGIGDTIRVSLTADPVREVIAAREILKATGRLPFGIEFVSCPTCARCNYPLIDIANQLLPEVQKREKAVRKRHIKVAIMGCSVNGPGEAKDAELAICGGDGFGLLCKNGEIIRKIEANKIKEEFLRELDLVISEKS
jgi:(E)-4-hydroxy-3-methylbut-2-enyl-diphosphate synthase